MPAMHGACRAGPGSPSLSDFPPPAAPTIRRRGDGRERIEMQHVVFPKVDNACPPSSGREPRAPQP